MERNILNYILFEYAGVTDTIKGCILKAVYALELDKAVGFAECPEFREAVWPRIGHDAEWAVAFGDIVDGPCYRAKMGPGNPFIVGTPTGIMYVFPKNPVVAREDGTLPLDAYDGDAVFVEENGEAHLGFLLNWESLADGIESRITE